MKRVLVWIIAMLSATALAGEWQLSLLKGSTTQQTVTAPTADSAWAKCVAQIPASAVPDATWKCQTLTYVAKVTKPVPVPPVTPPAPTPVAWVHAAAEAATFTLVAPAQVRYGAGTTWSATQTLLAGPVVCGNGTFGDPVPGVVKECQITPASALGAPPVTSQPPVVVPPVVTVPPAVGDGTATLSWSAPTQNTDGSALTDLAGYRVYHGTNASALSDVRQVPATSVGYVFGQLAAGTHYFAVTAYNAAGVESALSAVGSKVVP